MSVIALGTYTSGGLTYTFYGNRATYIDQKISGSTTGRWYLLASQFSDCYVTIKNNYTDTTAGQGYYATINTIKFYAGTVAVFQLTPATTISPGETVTFSLSDVTTLNSYASSTTGSVYFGIKANVSFDETETNYYDYSYQTNARITVIAPQLQSLSVDTTSATTSYYVDDTFDSSGVVVYANYYWYVAETLQRNEIVTDDATFSSPDMTSAGEKTVTVTYDSVSTTYTIGVILNAPTITHSATTSTYNYRVLKKIALNVYSKSATKYLIRITNNDLSTVADLVLDSSLGGEDITIPLYPWNCTYQIKALYDGTSNATYTYTTTDVGGTVTVGATYTEGDYDSAWSDTFTYDGSLDTPVLSVSASGTTASISWNAIENAAYYEIVRAVAGTTTTRSALNATSFTVTDDDVLNGESFTIRAKSLAYGWGEYAYSSYSNAIISQTEQLETPTIAWDGTNLSVTLPDYSNSFVLLVDGEEIAEVAGTTYDMSSLDLDDGTYSITVYAIASGETTVVDGTYTTYTNSGTSSALTLVESSLSAPTLTYTSSTYTFNWSSVSNATTYKLYISGSVAYSGSATSFVASDYSSGDSCYVTADGSYSVSDSTLTIYNEGSASNVISFGTLDTPTLTNEDNVLSWDEIENAAYYLIYEDDEVLAHTTDTTYTIDQLIEGTHTYYVVAMPSSANINQSSNSNTVSITWTKLEQPEVQQTISGTSVIVTGEYDTYCTIKLDVNGFSISAAADGSGSQEIDISSYVMNGQNLVYARVFSSQPLVIPSISSDRCYFNIDNSGNKFKAWINGVGYGVQLPVSVLFTMDETLDTGSIVLDIEDTADISEPFEAYTNLVLVSYDDENTEVERFQFKIEGDKVKELQYGDETKYLHEITIIELTKELQQTIMPDLTITQPLSLAGMTLEAGTRDDISSERTFFTEIDSSGILWGFSDSHSLTSGLHAWYNFYCIAVGENENGNKFSSIVANGLLSSVSNDQSIALPDWQISGIDFYKQTIDTWFGYANRNTSHTEAHNILHPEKRWYIRKRTSTDTQWDYDTALSYIENNNTSMFWAIKSSNDPISNVFVTFSDTGVYDIYLYTPGVSDSRLTNKTLYKDLSLSGDFTYTNTGTVITNGGLGYTSGILAIFHTSVGTISATNTEDEVTIGKAMDKILCAVEPQRIIKNALDNPKYTWELPAHTDEQCDEATWSGGKSLYEILSDVGRQFGGIPRLNKDNAISFDIMGETCTGNPAFDLVFPDSIKDSWLKTSESNMDNHASALVSQAKNIIAADNYEVFPYSGGWVSPRSSDNTSAYVTRANCAIILPHPIYQIVKVEVMDMKSHTSSGTTTEAGISYVIYESGGTQLVLESKIWGLLPETSVGKGSTLCYTRGDNKILNLGALSSKLNEDDTAAVFGLAEGVYVIGNIIHILNSYVPAADVDPNYLLFRVTYRPYIDEVIRAEQPDQSGEKAHSVSAFNQDANVVSDKRLGNVMENKASRLGNNSIQTMVRFEELSIRPMIGQVWEHDGETYYADKINLLVERTYCEATIQWTKNRNNIDPQVGVASEYRQYELYDDNYVTRQISIDSYAIVSLEEYTSADVDLSKLNSYGMASSIANFFNGNPDTRPSDFYITTFNQTTTDTFGVDYLDVSNTFKFNRVQVPTKPVTSKVKKVNLEQITFTDVSTDEEVTMDWGFQLHAHYRAIGNSVTFYAEAVDNYSMGVSACTEEDPVDPINWTNSSGAWVIRDSRYVDDLGRVDSVGIALGTISSNYLRYVELTTGESDTTTEQIARRYPLATFNRSPISYMKNCLLNSYFYVRKDNREKLAFQYACHFLSFDSDIKVKNALARHLFAPDFGTQGTISLVYFFTNPMDKENVNDYAIISSANTATQTNNVVTIMPDGESSLSVTPSRACYGWGYVINDGGIRPLIVVRQAMSSGETSTIPSLVITLTDSLPDWQDE